MKQEIQKKLGWVESWPLKITGEETKAVSVNIFSWGLMVWLATKVRPAFGVCKAHPCPFIQIFMRNGILLPKLFWPTERKNCSSDLEKLLKFKAKGPEFAKFLRSLEQLIWSVKDQNNVW